MSATESALDLAAKRLERAVAVLEQRLAERLKRATTVCPLRSVKLTKNRPVAAALGGNASPSSPCSPPDLTTGVRSMKSVPSTMPLRTTRMRPPCSTTN